MAANKNIVVRLLADASQYEATIAKAGKSTKELAGDLEKSGSKTGIVTKGVAAIGLAAAAAGAVAVKMAADFDQQMSTIQANTGATSSQLDQLREAAIQAGANTVYSASESADAINDLGKAGMSVTDILSGGLDGALNLAASDGMAVGTAAEYMANALTMFHLNGSQATEVADALAAGAGKAVGNVTDFGEALNNCGGQAYSFGISMQETVGTLGLFAQNGIVGAEAGTQLNSMLMKLASPTKDAQAVMDELGISAYDASGKFVGLAEFAGQLATAERDLTDEQRNQANATMFGSYAIKAANYLYQAGKEGVEQWTKAVSESGYAADQAAAKNDNLKGDIENLSGSFETLMLKIGEGGQGPLRAMTQTTDTLIDEFSQLPAPVQQSAIALAAMAGILAAAHKAATPLNTSTGALAQHVGSLIDPIQRVGTALPTLRAGLGQLGAAATMSGNLMASGMKRGELAMSGLKTTAKGVYDLMGGAWGIAFAVAGAAITEWAGDVRQAKQSVDELSDAMRSTGDVTETFVSQIKNMELGNGNGLPEWMDKLNTSASDVPDLLDKCGLSMSDLALASQGNKSALAKYQKAMDDLNGSYGVGTSRQKELGNLLDQATGIWDKAKTSAKQTATAIDDVNEANGTATQSAKENTAALNDQADAAEDAADAIDTLVKSLFGTQSANLTADEALTSMRKAILDLNDTARENGRVLDENGQAIDGYAEKAYDSQNALQSLASDAQNAATKILKAGEAYGPASDEMKNATDQAAAALDEARQAFISNAEASGMSRDAAERLADSYGLTASQIDLIKQQLQALEQTPETIDKKVTITDEASDTLDKVGVKAKEVDGNPAQVKITCDDLQFRLKIKDVLGISLDKHGTFTADKYQYDQILALANGATLDDKTGYLKGDNSDAMKKFLETQGWHLDDKGFIVNADGTPALNVLRDLDSRQIADKYFTVHGTYVDESGGTYSSSGYRPKGAVGNIPTGIGGYTGGGWDGSNFRYASGGSFDGYVNPKWAPTMRSKTDQVWLANARLDLGEYVMKRDSADYYGTDLMTALNDRRVPRELFSAPSTPQIVVNMPQPAQQQGNVELNMPVKVVRADADLATASTILIRQAMREVRR